MMSPDNSKNNRIGMFYAALLFAAIFCYPAFEKATPGGDERVFIALGIELFETGEYLSTKHQPLYAIFSGAIVKLSDDALLASRLIYVFSAALLGAALFQLQRIIIGEEELVYLQLALVALLPGILFLGLYSGTSLLYTALSYWALVLIYRALTNRSLYHAAVAGGIAALAYMTRMDGLILVLLIALVILIDAFQREEWNWRIVAAFSVVFLFGILPWHLFLISNDLMLSSVTTGGWNSGIWSNGPAKVYLEKGFSTDQGIAVLLEEYLSALSDNVRLFSEHIGSVRLFPFFLWPLVGIGLIRCKWRSADMLFVAPIGVSMVYLLFYVEARYLIPVVPLLGLLAAKGLQDFAVSYKISDTKAYVVLITLLAIMNIGYSLFGHTIYHSL